MQKNLQEEGGGEEEEIQHDYTPLKQDMFDGYKVKTMKTMNHGLKWV